MPGPAFHIVLLEQVIDKLSAGSADDKKKAAILRNNLAFATLGALGPDFLRYRPVPVAAVDTFVTVDVQTLDAATKQALAKQIFDNPEMAPYAVAYRLLVPHYPELAEIEAFLAALAVIGTNEDLEALKAQKDTMAALQPKIDGLKLVADEATKIYKAGAFAATAGKPPIQFIPSLPAKNWRGVEYLRWKHTGAFAQALVKQAEIANDDQLRAYAYGYLAHVAGAVIGEPFVNSITGGPYRTHWWRGKWVRNHVDAWTHGRYHTPATMAGDAPTPPYDQWANLYGTNLQDRVRVDPGLAGPDAVAAVVSGMMPATPGFDKVAAMFAAAVTGVYGALPAPQVPPASLTDATALREAYVGTLSVLWFMTAQQPVGPAPLGTPPPGAEVPPDWYVNGTPPPTPAPTPSGGSSSSSTISAIIAAILGVVAIVFSSIAFGAGAIALAIAAALAGGGSLDWTEFRKTIYWMQMQFYNAENALQDALVKGGLAYPLARKLGSPPVGIFGSWLPVWDQTMVPLTKSRETRLYPMQMQAQAGGQPADTDFLNDPTTALEADKTRSLFALNVYAEAVVDAGLQNGGMLTDNGAFPTRDADFGGALANAVALIQAQGVGLASYNLDGDRGYGWKTWKPKAQTAPADPNVPVSIVEE